MNILILGLNYAPEQVGIGPYTCGMATALAAAGHQVTVVCGKPYYPKWKVDPLFEGGGVRRSDEDGVTVVRVPIYVPANPNGMRRLLHHASFAVRAQPVLLREAVREKPDVVIGIAPSLVSLVAARVVARLSRAKLWIHIQDFEVEAAVATGLLRPTGRLTCLARAFEVWSMRADRISTISPQMCDKLISRGINATQVIEFRNWANVDKIRPLCGSSVFRSKWSIDHRYIALYSGNIANKQGIEIIIDAARLLTGRRDLLFIICGNGPNRDRLQEQAKELNNIRFFDLQPTEMLSDLLGLASVHLLPQIAGAADLVLPSKLTNMLASGRPVIATALPGTGLAYEVDGCGILVQPDDAPEFAKAIERLLDDDSECKALGVAARRRAEERWSRNRILAKFESALRALQNSADPVAH
jgi:colanic acid biosynthesis glycosyl transferase WcaI